MGKAVRKLELSLENCQRPHMPPTNVIRPLLKGSVVSGETPFDNNGTQAIVGPSERRDRW